MLAEVAVVLPAAAEAVEGTTAEVMVALEVEVMEAVVSVGALVEEEASMVGMEGDVQEDFAVEDKEEDTTAETAVVGVVNAAEEMEAVEVVAAAAAAVVAAQHIAVRGAGPHPSVAPDIGDAALHAGKEAAPAPSVSLEQSTHQRAL